jgi:hypothetical protein
MNFRLLLCAALLASAVFRGDALEIRQEKGADQRVKYENLTRLGPWDDRNYKLTLEDLEVFTADEYELQPGMPAFYRVELRKRFPWWPRTGPGQYPRAARQLFEIEYGGFLVDGHLQSRRMLWSRSSVPVSGEIRLNDILGANEITIEINPVFHNRVIAGANNIGGQEMYYSSDGGETWSIAGTLPNTCCDPTLGWSTDGLIAYAGALSSSIGVSFFRSTNFGQSWGAAQILTQSGSDKEFLHVDLSPASPYKDHIYLTWHDGNIMQFARSRDRGATFDPVHAFDDAPMGIGSDITSDTEGNIYYLYAAFDSPPGIVLLKSTDGGDTWSEPMTIAPTIAEFTFPIPSMDKRFAWVYAAADCDTSGGPYNDSIYCAWTDITAPESINPAANHAYVKVAYSRDGGETWTERIVHETHDIEQVDRYNQWVAVDENGGVHAVYYDTRHSINRTGNDLYYTFSVDGGDTWVQPARVSGETSAKLTDFQEFGDYNGIAVLGDKLLPAWTDNRTGPPNARDVFVANATNLAAGPTFLLFPLTEISAACRPGGFSTEVEVSGILDFAGEVALSVSGAPPGLTASVSATSVTPPATVSVSLDSTAGLEPGVYGLTLLGESGDITRDARVAFSVVAQVPGTPTLKLPPNNAEFGGYPEAQLSWQEVPEASAYHVQVSDAPGFGSLLHNLTVEGTAFTAGGLTENAEHYWRVAAINACGQGGFSSPFRFFASKPEGQGADECADAPLLIFNVPLAGTTADATGTDITSCATNDTIDVWFRMEAPETGTVVIDLCDSSFDTSLAVFDACGGTELTCNDDYCSLASTVFVPVQAGETYYVRISGWSGETGEYVLFAAYTEGGEGEGEDDGPVDCLGASMTDGVGGGVGSTLALGWLDPLLGGKGGQIAFRFPHPERVDRISILGTDGFSRTITATETLTTLDIASIEDGSPKASNATTLYTIGYEVESPAGSGTYVTGEVCTLTATWQPASCTVELVPPAPVVGGAAQVRVLATNVRYNPLNSRFATLTSDAANWTGDIALSASAPNFSLAGHTLVYQPAVSIAAWAPGDAGVYSTIFTGPGPANTSQCGVAPETGDLAIHSADTTGDGAVDLSELLRVIQLYNSLGYQCAANPGATEDGFMPGAGPNHLCRPHNADYDGAGPDWKLSLTELLRVIQIYNVGAYSYCPGSGTEDGYCPG